MKKNIVIASLFFGVLLAVIIVFSSVSTAAPADKITLGDKSYTLFSSCAKDLGYEIKTNKNTIKTDAGEKYTEYQYFLEHPNSKSAGALSVTIFNDEIASASFSGDVVNVFHISQNDITFVDGQVYVVEHGYSVVP